MIFIAITRYIKPLAEVDLYRAAHIDYFKPFITNHQLLCMGRQAPPTGAVIVSLQANRHEFETILQNDPYQKAGVVEYQIYQFNPALYHTCLTELLE